MTNAVNDQLPYTRESRALLPDAMRLGPVRLAVTDLSRSIEFYRSVIGLEVAWSGREGAYEVARLSAGGVGMEDVLVLQEEPDAGTAKYLMASGLYHVALNYPSRIELARTARRIAETRTPIQGASNHQTHEAIYLADPDGNGLELAWDAPRERWPTTLSTYMSSGREPLDIEGLLALTAAEPRAPRAANGLRVGHVHLHVGSVARARDFYVDLVGFELQFELDTAAFTSAARYHHHLGFNTWRGEGAGPMPGNVVGLREWSIYLPTAGDVDAVRDRLESKGVHVTTAGSGAFTTADPWGIPLRVAPDPSA